MTTEEKLERFQKYCLENARVRSANMLDEYTQALEKTFEEHQADAHRRADMQIKAETQKIQKDINKSYELTRRWNMAAVITDGSAVLGLGDIGPEAGMPVMEGKCALFKKFGDVDAFPICIDSHDTDEIVNTAYLISKSFGGINLEDIAAPQCFEVERRLKEMCDIPVFHDDQHGTAVVVCAALLNAVKLTGKKMGELKIVINGDGAAGTAIAKLILKMNFGEVIVCGLYGMLSRDMEDLNPARRELANITNPRMLRGDVREALKGADVLVGVSAPGVITRDMVAGMNDGIVFAMANPVPEIMPEEALAGGAKVVGTGRSDYHNQINNVLVFPGIFKGALKAHARAITDEMKEAAARAVASIVSDEELSSEYIIPSIFDSRVADAVAAEVEKFANK